MSFEVGHGEGGHSRQEEGSEQRLGEVGCAGQEAGPDSGEVAGLPLPQLCRAQAWRVISFFAYKGTSSLGSFFLPSEK